MLRFWHFMQSDSPAWKVERGINMGQAAAQQHKLTWTTFALYAAMLAGSTATRLLLAFGLARSAGLRFFRYFEIIR